MKHPPVGEVSREQLLQRVAALESHQRAVDRQLLRWRSSAGFLVILGLLLLPLRHGKAQSTSQTGGVPTVSQQIAALQAAVAHLQSTAVMMDSSGKVAIPGPLVAMQGAMVQGHLMAMNGATVQGNLMAMQGATVQGNLMAMNGATVQGNLMAMNDAAVQGSLTATSANAGSASVSGPVTAANGTFANVTVNNHLGAPRIETTSMAANSITTAGIAATNATVLDNLDVPGNLAAAHGNFTNGLVVDTLTVAYQASVGGLITKTGATINGPLNATFIPGPLTVGSDLSAYGSLNGHTVNTGDLAVGGNATFSQDVSVSGNIGVQKGTFLQDLHVNGEADFGKAIAGPLSIAGDLSVSGNLQGSHNLELGGGIQYNGGTLGIFN